MAYAFEFLMVFPKWQHLGKAFKSQYTLLQLAKHIANLLLSPQQEVLLKSSSLITRSWKKLLDVHPIAVFVIAGGVGRVSWIWVEGRNFNGNLEKEEEWATAVGDQWETRVQGKELHLGESGKDVARFLSLLLASVRCVCISRSVFPISDAAWREGGVFWKQVLCQRTFSPMLGRLFWSWETFWERKTSCILIESKEHWPPVICSCHGLEAEG